LIEFKGDLIRLVHHMNQTKRLIGEKENKKTIS